MTVPPRPIARDFVASRARFAAAAKEVGASFEEIPHPLTGPAGEPLATDIAMLGDVGTEALLVLITGVHGVEHYAGSACISEWLEALDPRSLPSGTAVLAIHAINPWGAAWCRRYNEDNIDLARNFLDFTQPLPEHPPYEVVHPFLANMQEGGAQEIVEHLCATLGERETIDALMSGQYRYPSGFSFGGAAPSWSNRTVRQILETRAKGSKRVCLVEFHSGLGPWGEVMPVTMQSGRDLDRVHCFFGSQIIAPRVDEGTHSAPGHTTDGYIEILEGCEVTSIVVEFGTYPPSRSLPVLLEDHRVHSHGLASTKAGREVASANLEMHCPADQEWQRTIISRGMEMIERSIEGFQKCH